MHVLCSFSAFSQIYSPLSPTGICLSGPKTMSVVGLQTQRTSWMGMERGRMKYPARPRDLCRKARNSFRSSPEACPSMEERGPQPQTPPFPPFLLSQPSGLMPEYHPLCTFLFPTSVQPISINNFDILGILDMKISKPSSCL